MGIPLNAPKGKLPIKEMTEETSNGVICGKGEGIYYIYSRHFPSEVQLTVTELPTSFPVLRLGQWIQFVAERIGDTFSVVAFKLIPLLFPTLQISDLVVAIECLIFIPDVRPAANQSFKCEVSDEVYDQKQLVQHRHLGQNCRGTIAYYQQSGRGVWVVEYVE